MSINTRFGAPKSHIELINKSGKKLTAFPRIIRAQTVTSLDISNNPIPNFKGMVTMPNLDLLKIDNTLIKSFEGAVQQNALTVIMMDKAPISLYPHVQLMSCIVFGDSLRRVNKINVTKKDIKLANELRESLFESLVEGWIITSISPIRLFNTITQKRKVVYKIEKIEKPLLALTILPEYQAQNSTQTSPEPSPKKSVKKVHSPLTLKKHKNSPQKQKKENNDPPSPSKLSAGAIAGIVIGAVVVISGIIGVIIYFKYK